MFVSGDRTHDGPLAMMAWEKVAITTKKANRSPNHIIMWSDGAPNQFKYTYPVWFLSKLKRIGGFEKVWWNFFASCHGKGMQDAAGAWIKTRVSKAILLGGEIRSVRDFFNFCETFLTYQAAEMSHVTKAASFTSHRIFYMLEPRELALYRANAEQVNTWKGLRFCHFFWAGMEVDEVGRKWVGCGCKACLDEKFDMCMKRPLFMVDGVDVNAPVLSKLVAKAPCTRTQAEDIAASRSFLKDKSKVGVSTVLAIRPGKIVDADDIDFESDNDENGESLEVHLVCMNRVK